MQDQDRIRRRAHDIWEREGRPEGRSAEHWAQACREIEAEGKAAPGSSPTPTAPDHGGTTPGEAAAAAATFERQSDAEGGAASAEPAASSGSPTPTGPDHGGTTPGEAAAAAATVGAPRTAEGATKAKR